MPIETIIDFNKERAKPITETEEYKKRQETWQKIIKENGLQGFFNQSRSYPPTGIVLDYDVDEIKNRGV
jgi:lantibiotic modifying enzyme